MDPAAAAGIEDPWLAMQLRAGLFMRLREEEHKAREEQEQQGDQERDPLAVMREQHSERLDQAQKILLGLGST